MTHLICAACAIESPVEDPWLAEFCPACAEFAARACTSLDDEMRTTWLRNARWRKPRAPRGREAA